MNAAEVKSAVFASVGCLVGMLAVHEANKFAYEKYEYKVGCPPSGPDGGQPTLYSYFS